MSKADERRAAIVAQQAAREQAEREAQQVPGQAPVRSNRARPRINWSSFGSSPGGGGARRGRPPKP